VRACLIEGLSQAACDCRLPEVIVRKSLDKFLANELDNFYPPEKTLRLLAHPPEEAGNLKSIFSFGA
jgi:hypothetical protein